MNLDWMQEALCRGFPEVFCAQEESFGSLDADPLGKNEARAKAICGMCPVKDDCLAFALVAENDPYFVWGGYTPYERRLGRLVASHGIVRAYARRAVSEPWGYLSNHKTPKEGAAAIRAFHEANPRMEESA